MSKQKAYRHKTAGFTLTELMVAIVIMTTLSMATRQIWTSMIPRHRVQTATANLHSMIRNARSAAISDGNQLLCDAEHGCSAFKRTNRIKVGHDQNRDGALSSTEIVEEYVFPEGVFLVWKRFRGNSLLFGNRGISHFQNGSFYICNDVAARRIIMNWVGRPRVEAASPHDCN